jgi:hypothetical protein
MCQGTGYVPSVMKNAGGDYPVKTVPLLTIVEPSLLFHF